MVFAVTLDLCSLIVFCTSSVAPSTGADISCDLGSFD